VDPEQFRQGMRNFDARLAFRIRADYPGAARLMKLLQDYGAALAAQRQRQNEETIRRWQAQIQAQWQAYQNWVNSHQQQQATQYYYVPAAPSGGQHHSAGAIPPQ
jgi:hypothetical protein